MGDLLTGCAPSISGASRFRLVQQHHPRWMGSRSRCGCHLDAVLAAQNIATGPLQTTEPARHAPHAVRPALALYRERSLAVVIMTEVDQGGRGGSGRQDWPGLSHSA